MELHEKSLYTLELPAVLDMLAAQAVSDPAKERALALRPAIDVHEVRRRLGETSAAKDLITLYGEPSFREIKEVAGILARADSGGMLNTRELLDVASVLRCARSVKAYADGEGAAKTAISYLFSGIQTNKYLEEKITNSIVGEDEIADAASPELAQIRRHMRAANARVRETLQRIISSPAYSKALQEQIITQRSGRYVVPVKADHKGSVPGLVHDISSSGATLFVEPMSVVQANNEIRELEAREKKEIERILMELSAEAAAHKEDILRDFDVLVALDLIFAKGKLSFRLDAMEPRVEPEGEVILRRARHPLLPLKTAVPIDIAIGGATDTFIITGPNTGGKTVSIKTLGLLCLMSCCGLHIPVSDGSQVRIFRQILADIGDEQSIEQSLSTFSSHMTNIVEILKACGPDTLLLLDELGAGTDPVEGAALAISIIEYARRRGAKIAATTHYPELKIYAMSTPGVENASCEFDVETLKPTYRLILGVPGKSNAFAISARLGIPAAVIEEAKDRMDLGSAKLEAAIGGLEEQRQAMEQETQAAQALHQKAAREAAQAETYRKELEAQREKAAQTAKREAEEILRQARAAADLVFEELDNMRRKSQKEQDWQRQNEARAQIRHQLNQAEEALSLQQEPSAPPPASSRPLRPGDTVELLRVGTRATVISVASDHTVTLQAGILKVTAKEDELRLIEGAEQKPQPAVAQRAQTKLRSLGAASEIDLRGMTADEAVSAMERCIDSAMLANLNTVTVIHGKGTGVLRRAVQEALKRNRQVKSFRLGRYGEGESGVTIVELK